MKAVTCDRRRSPWFDDLYVQCPNAVNGHVALPQALAPQPPAAPTPKAPGVIRGVPEFTNKITWQATSQAESGYLVIGPGLSSQGLETPNNPSTARRAATGALARGTHAWFVIPYWETPEGRVIDDNRGARATATIP
jgi:hypothetical protein